MQKIKIQLYLVFIGSSLVLAGCQPDQTAESPDEYIETPPPPRTNFKAHPKNVILMIGDGMGLTQVTAGLIAKKDALAITRFPIIGLVNTFAGNNIITDSAAGATAMATGKKTYRGAIGVDMDTVPLPTILEIAEKHRLATGLIATSSITHATPASFIAHQPDRHMPEAIAADFVKTPVDLIMGGGKKYFADRKDNKNYIDSLKQRGYTVVTSVKEAKTVNSPLACFTANKHPKRISENRGSFLPEASQTAIDHLKKDTNGFFLMIEGSQIDWGGHEMETQYIVEEMVDFDNAIEKVLAFASKDSNTLVLVTADHECGGFSINGGSYNKGKVKGKFTTDYHTATMVPLFAFGPGAEQFKGIQDNTALFYKIKRALRLD